MSCTTITYSEWLEKYQPVKNTVIDNAPYSGHMFETYGKEESLVRDAPSEFVWTLVDTDKDVVVMAGYHHVNRLGYFITRESHHGACIDAVNDDLE